MYENIRKIQDIEVKGKTVVVRANFDVPVENDLVQDDTKIRAVIKTLEYLLAQNCKIVLISHRGNPKGESKDDLSLMPVRFELSHILNKPIKFAHIHACENSIKFMENGEILLLENLKFSKSEESGTLAERKEFLSPLAKHCDIYVSEAFGEFDELASILDLPQIMPSVAGFNLQKEVECIEKLNTSAQSPYVTVIGGSKFSDNKAEFIRNAIETSDSVLMGGRISQVFMKAKGIDIGDQEISAKELKLANSILKETKKSKCEILLPVDHIAAESLDSKSTVEVDTQQLKKGMIAFDIGHKTLAIYREVIESAKTVVWYGAMGVFENELFNKGTEAVGEYIALSTPKECYKIAGGSSTTYAMRLLKIKPKRFNHISIGEEMMLKYIVGESFSVLNVLTD